MNKQQHAQAAIQQDSQEDHMTRRKCLYCSAQVRGVRKGEHIIPASLGRALSLRNVCGQCNNELSVIDKELVSKTPMNVIASEELDRTAEGVWDYNQEFDVALEAHVLQDYAAPVLWPQVVFEQTEPKFWFDAVEGRRVGAKRFLKRFVACLMRARNTLRDGSKRPLWLWEPVAKPPRRGRFPPRVYTRHPFHELHGRIHFECRYKAPVDRGRLLYSVDNWRPLDGRMKFKECWGAIDPEAQFSYRPRYVLRALVKIGLNLLAYLCEETAVNQQTFSEAIQFARYDRGDGPSLDDCGFVRNGDVQALDCPGDAHALRLTYGPNWALDCAFFGGRIAATVSFPGPNYEKWQRAEIIAPIGSRDWLIRTSRVILPRRMRVEWKDLSVVVPSLPIKNVESRFRIEQRPRS